MKNYPMEVNGWYWSLDADSMSYWKDFDEGHSEAVALCWLETVVLPLLETVVLPLLEDMVLPHQRASLVWAKTALLLRVEMVV